MAVSVDVREGTTTGISASDRAKTVCAVADYPRYCPFMLDRIADLVSAPLVMISSVHASQRKFRERTTCGLLT
jgi:3,4-dihydroxy-2-butanone 4-phosphate synthase